MKRRFRLIGLLFAFLWANVSLLTAQGRYQTDLLANMAESLKLSDQLATLENGCYRSKFFYKKRPLNVFVDNGTVTHIGYVLFSDGQRKALNSPVYNFLERYVLAADLPLERQKSVSKQLAEDEINFMEGNFSSLSKLIGDTTLNLTIENLNEKRYKVGWYKKEALFCSIDFPIGYDLLHGTEIVENERRIAEDIQHAPLLSVEPLSVKRELLLSTWQPNYFILPGESYYTDQLSTNRYYEKQNDGTFQLIFNRKYPQESLANLLTTLELKNSFQVHVRLKKYDFKEDNFKISLAQFMSFFMRQGCVPYFGVISYEETTLVCELVMRKPDEGYCHIMKVTFNVEQLLDKGGEIAVRLNSFIPTSKIKNLFEDLKK